MGWQPIRERTVGSTAERTFREIPLCNRPFRDRWLNVGTIGPLRMAETPHIHSLDPRFLLQEQRKYPSRRWLPFRPRAHSTSRQQHRITKEMERGLTA